MNTCFFSGKVISNVIFKFIMSKNVSFKECKNISICYFYIQLENKTILKFKAYDDLADVCFKNIKQGDFVIFSGRINSDLEVEVDFFEKLDFPIEKI